MARHVWSVLCYKSVIDRDENQISLLAVTERLILNQSPEEYELLEKGLLKAKEQDKALAVPVTLELANWWVRSDPEKPEAMPARVRIIAQDGWEFPRQDMKVDLEHATGQRIRLKIDTFLFRGFGLYWFLVESKPGKRWRTDARIPLEVVKAEAPAA